jgi:hypothetical protein
MHTFAFWVQSCFTEISALSADDDTNAAAMVDVLNIVATELRKDNDRETRPIKLLLLDNIFGNDSASVCVWQFTECAKTLSSVCNCNFH